MSSDDGVVVQVVGALSRALTPLVDASASSEGLSELLSRLGWASDPNQQVVSAVGDAIPPLQKLASDVAKGAGSPTLLADAIAAMTALAGLRNVALGPGAGAPFDDPTFWSSLPEALLALLVWEDLRAYAPRAFGLLSFLGAFRSNVQPADPATGRQSYQRRVVDWGVLGRAAASPSSWFTDVYGWGAKFDYAGFLDAVTALGAGVGGAVCQMPPHPLLDSQYVAPDNPDRRNLRVLSVSPFVVEPPSLDALVKPALIVLPLPPAQSRSNPPDGILIWPTLTGAASAAIELEPAGTLTLGGDFQASPVRIQVRPTGTLVEGASTAFASSARVDIDLPAPFVMGGTGDGTRLELTKAHFGLQASSDGTQTEVVIDAALDEATAVLNLGAADAFLRGIIGAEPYTAPISANLAWSSVEGLTFSGLVQPKVTLPVDLVIAGVLTIGAITIELGQGDAGTARMTVSLSGGVSLPGFAATVDDLGIALDAAPATLDAPGNFGLLDLSLGFKPPSRLGLTADLEGIVTGGGYAAFDDTIGRYSGALAFEALAVGLAAVVVVDTRLAGDPDGWAFFASVSATFPGIPLGFGFFLSGVGGLVCLNRTMDTEALGSGLRGGAVDSLLFPDDPLVDAPAIITQLDDWFPQAPDNMVFGVAATITWGAPKALVTGQLAVLLSVPSFDLALLGSIAMVLPDEQQALLELHMDSLGTIDVAEGTVTVEASLYDSSILRTIQLSGDMAMYGRFGAQPYFLLSIGGYSPDFHPPGYLPASMTTLRRIGYEVALSEDIWFGLSGYLAATSNTLQFGAEAAIEAKASFLDVTYVAEGSFGFDVLLVLAPFAFTAEASAMVTISALGSELFNVLLSAHLEGPHPWYATARARFEFLGLEVPFEVAFGGAAGALAPPTANLLDAVIDALSARTAWCASAPAGETVLLAEDDPGDDDGIVRVRPDAELEVKQGVAPLDRGLDVYGAYAIAGPSTLHLEDAGIDGPERVGWEPIEDWFAPAQFDRMNQTQRIAAPSYERMNAGVRLKSGPVSFGTDTRSLVPDYEVRIIEGEHSRGLGRDSLLGTTARAGGTTFLAGWLRTSRRASLPVRFDVQDPSWTLADAESGENAGEPGSYHDALVQLSARTASDPTSLARLRAVPAHAVRERR